MTLKKRENKEEESKMKRITKLASVVALTVVLAASLMAVSYTHLN